MTDNREESRTPSCVLPSPDQLLEGLRYAVDDVFATMVSEVAVLSESRLASDCPAGTSRIAGHSVDMEAVVEFIGAQCGAVVLRCSNAGALDITRGLLMLPEDEHVGLDEIEDALGECANMVSGSLKARALDTLGEFSLRIPRIETYKCGQSAEHCGTLVYWLSAGSVSIEIWFSAAE